eukprot:Em0009g910a
MYRQLWTTPRRPKLRPSDVYLRTYTGERIQVKGQITVEAKYGGSTQLLDILVVGAIFQSVIEGILSGIHHVNAYMDDVLVTNDTEAEHLSTLEEVLARLEQYGGYGLNKAKWDGVRPTQEKLQAIVDAPAPKDVSQLKSFLGLAVACDASPYGTSTSNGIGENSALGIDVERLQLSDCVQAKPTSGECRWAKQAAFKRRRARRCSFTWRHDPDDGMLIQLLLLPLSGVGQIRIQSCLWSDEWSCMVGSHRQVMSLDHTSNHVRSAPYHPATNGLAERAVQTVKDALKKTSGDIDTRLSRFLFQNRLTPHSSTGQSPAKLLLGRVPRSHLDFLFPDVADNVKQNQQRQKQNHDQRATEHFFVVGDKVYALNHRDTMQITLGLVNKMGEEAKKMKTKMIPHQLSVFKIKKRKPCWLQIRIRPHLQTLTGRILHQPQHLHPRKYMFTHNLLQLR